MMTGRSLVALRFTVLMVTVSSILSVMFAVELPDAHGTVCCTQPRRLAATLMQKRVAIEFQCKLLRRQKAGEQPPAKVRFNLLVRGWVYMVGHTPAWGHCSYQTPD